MMRPDPEQRKRVRPTKRIAVRSEAWSEGSTKGGSAWQFEAEAPNDDDGVETEGETDDDEL
jgi:hypothetical protein